MRERAVPVVTQFDVFFTNLGTLCNSRHLLSVASGAQKIVQTNHSASVR